MFDVKKWEKEKVKELAEEIQIYQREISQSHSHIFIKDRQKYVDELMRDLMEFCEIRELNFKEIKEKYGI